MTATDLALRSVRYWTRLYTLGLPARVRESRLSEIECDLWECQRDPDRPTGSIEIFVRLFAGLPDDLLWRLERTGDADGLGAISAPGGYTVIASAFTCSFTLHVIALTAAVWWASWPAERALPPPMPRDHTLAGPALFAGPPLTVPDAQPGSSFGPSGKDTAMKKAALLIGAIIGTVGLPTAAQQNGSPAFEAATIRPNASGYAGWRLEPQPGGRLTATNVPAAALIRFAYDLPDFQVSGGPGWLNSSRFDIAATGGADAPVSRTRSMVRTLLADRFKLMTHTETRELPIYALVMARSDGRLGPQLRRSEVDCATQTPESNEWGGVGPASGAPRCGFFGFAPGTDLPKGRGGLAFRGLTLAAFAKRLVPMVRRSVADHTALTGYFDADFDFVAELPPPPPPPGLPSAFSEPFVSLFTVLPEQLGLKLDARRGPVEVLVIDRIEQPARE